MKSAYISVGLFYSLVSSTIATPLLWTDKNPSSTASVHTRSLPEPVDAATAKIYLASLKVEAENNQPPYKRELFPHWIEQSGECNTREVVLQRDGTDIKVDEKCRSVSGTWLSIYDNKRWTNASDIDIDHVVPLREAWVSGARNWTTAQRTAFANDLIRPQLIAVTDRVNQNKGDKDPAEWMPSVEAVKCLYLRAWVHVKYFYQLSVNAGEKKAIEDLMASC